MSGHSKWSTIKRQKGINDQAKGKLFSKFSKAISVAVKSGGGPNPDSNYKLRIAIDAARAGNMPKENIKRAIDRASETASSLIEAQYEGFGPANIGILVEVTTDNKNRAAQEVKLAFDRGGGRMAGPGSVAFNFNKRGYILVEKTGDVEAQMLTIIDLGVEDVSPSDEGLEVYVAPTDLYEKRQAFEESGFKVIESEIVQIPVSTIKVADEAMVQKVYKLLDALEGIEDVEKVFTNADIE